MFKVTFKPSIQGGIAWMMFDACAECRLTMLIAVAAEMLFDIQKFAFCAVIAV